MPTNYVFQSSQGWHILTSSPLFDKDHPSPELALKMTKHIFSKFVDFVYIIFFCFCLCWGGKTFFQIDTENDMESHRNTRNINI